MKILIPTDFSKPSKVAVQYAAAMAKKLKSELVLLHVVYIIAPPRVAVASMMNSLDDAMKESAERESHELINELKTVNKNLKVSYEIIRGGTIVDEVQAYTQQNDIDLIIMGTKGASGLSKVLIGSTAAAVVSESNIPVMIVPEYARFNGIKRIVYASDMSEAEEELQTLIPFARLFGAKIYILHVMTSDSSQKMDTLKIQKDFVRKYKFEDVSVHVSKNDEITEGIDEFIADINADMLSMFTHEFSFFEKLFGKSVTRQMAFHTRIPLLAIKKADMA